MHKQEMLISSVGLFFFFTFSTYKGETLKFVLFCYSQHLVTFWARFSPDLAHEKASEGASVRDIEVTELREGRLNQRSLYLSVCFVIFGSVRFYCVAGLPGTETLTHGRVIAQQQ